MSMFHTCHTCGQSYPCDAKWCPGCGKRLGHKYERGDDAAAIVVQDVLGEYRHRCSTCGSVSMFVTDPRFCATCGAKFTETVPSPEVVENERRKREFAEKIGVAYVPRY